MTPDRVPLWLLIGLLVVVSSFACSDGDDGDIVTRFPMAGASMQPGIQDGDDIVVRRYLNAPATGDIIAFLPPTNTTRIFVKRVIAGPGQTVEILPDAEEVRVDGELLSEPYVQGQTTCGAIDCTHNIPVVKSGAPRVPGVTSPRPRPVDPSAEAASCADSGCYFVLGDNRQNSSDSRQGWLVPTENIIGYVDTD